MNLEGVNNLDLEKSRERLIWGASYRDLSTVCILPTKDGFLHHRVTEALENLIKPMNQGFYKLNLAGFEVGDAYNTGIQAVLAHPDLNKWTFLLTAEHDNLPPVDGLIKLQAAMYAHCERDSAGRVVVDERGHPKFTFAGIGGLYWTKGEIGVPMIYGHPREFPVNFRPQPVVANALQECRGIAMGFTLWNLGIFKDPRFASPWFETLNSYDPQKGVSLGTQDLTACARLQSLGMRVAVDTSCRVGHMELNGENRVW